MNAAEVLGVRPGAPPAEVRAAWRRHSRRTHPDLGGDPVAFHLGLEAYRRLTGAAPPHAVAVQVVPHQGPLRLAARWWQRRRRRRLAPRVV